MIIGISAKKQGGKSVAANILSHCFKEMDIKCFADPLKQIVLRWFVPRELNLTLVDLLRDEVKNMVMPCGKTIRELLQVVGTDWFRTTDPEVWIRALDNSIKNREEVVVIPDVRFSNEVEYVQSQGGIVIRLLRAPFGDEDQHASETALDEMERDSQCWTNQDIEETPDITLFDFVIDNRELSISENGRKIHAAIKNAGISISSISDKILMDIEEYYNATST